MTDATDPSVDAARPDSPISIRGTDHITVEGTNTEDTVEFYRDLLGMPLVLRQPNLDRRHLTHLFFDAGDGRMLTFPKTPPLLMNGSQPLASPRPSCDRQLRDHAAEEEVMAQAADPRSTCLSRPLIKCELTATPA